MRRVLIVSYYFPPSGGPGVQRVLKMVRYLRDYGWEPVVLTVEEGAYPDHDPSLWEDVPGDVIVHRTRAWDPYRWYARLTGRSAGEAVTVGSVAGSTSWQERLARWVRANVFLPDARVGWVPYAVIAIQKIWQHYGIDALLTSGPPHSVHLAGLLGQRWTGTPWVADFRDPWTDINYYHELPHSSLALRLDAAMERAVLRQATRVTTVSPTWARLLRGKVGRSADEIRVVQNGFDPEDVAAVTAAPPADRFMLTHVGSL
ncbi:MAG: glycosyltransferase, partial [Bacteroidetes bacterium]|nr:glycosyltransferase [Bacteroidota bacterium]